MSAPRAGWELVVLLAVPAGAALPGLFDLDVFKTGVLAVLAAAVLLPWLIWAGRDDVGAWLSTTGARLHLFSIAWALLASLSVLRHAAVADRLLSVALCHVAAVLGLRAARRGSRALLAALQAAALLTAVVALLQAVGMDRLFTTGPEEIVALTGNSTRAGALLALGVVAAFAAVTDRQLDARDWRLRLALGTLLLGTTALVLTRARGGWLAAAGGMLAVGLLARETAVARLRLWAPRVLLGAGLAVLFAGDWHVLTAAKLPGSGPVLAGADLTTRVRLSIWRACLPMIGSQPLEGFGLGRFRESFPPFRDPVEAALPGLAGARTEVDHPHNEIVLALAEGGLPSGLCLLAFAALTLRRGWRRARDTTGGGDVLAFGVLVAGTLVALVQNAWVSPGTALPYFAAAGWVLRPDTEASPAPVARAAAAAGLLALMAGLLVLALPRLDSHLQLRRFLLHAEHEGGVTLESVPLLVAAADADPGDPDVQRVLLHYGSQVQAAAPGASPGLPQALQRARSRLAELAPHADAAR